LRSTLIESDPTDAFAYQRDMKRQNPAVRLSETAGPEQRRGQLPTDPWVKKAN
jgi:hypothetical protein